MSIDSTFEVLLIMAAKKSAENEVSELMKLDTSEMTISLRERHRFERIINKKNKISARVKILLVACLIITAIGLTACATVPQIREKIKELVVLFNEKYFTVSFDSSVGKGDNNIEDKIPFSDSAESTNQTEKTIEGKEPIDPPKRIEKKAYISYLPGNYHSIVLADMRKQYEIRYFDSNDELQFRLKQTTIETESLWMDSEVSAEKVYINGNIAFLTKKIEGERILYSLVWRDEYYEYTLIGYFAEKNTIILVANSVKTE